MNCCSEYVNKDVDLDKLRSVHVIQFTLNRLFVKQLGQANIDEDIETPHYWPFVREPPVTDGFSSQGASYVENALMALCHNDKKKHFGKHGMR